MREKSMKLLVTFHTTAGAMAMEKYCKAQEAPGRLIPVPRSITADCGLCWMAPHGCPTSAGGSGGGASAGCGRIL